MWKKPEVGAVTIAKMQWLEKGSVLQLWSVSLSLSIYC